MTTQKYNGWSNYETWCVSLWLSNEQHVAEFWQRQAQRMTAQAPETAQVQAAVWTADEAARFHLAELIEADVTEDNPLEKPSVYSDLLRAALDEVHWDEIAADLLEQDYPPPPSNVAAPSETEASFRFALGKVVTTPGAIAEVALDEITVALNRHARGDWGLVGEDDAKENELALRQGFRLLSAYESASGQRFWIITEADRSVTTILLPGEY